MLAKGEVIRTYTYVDIDPLSRNIARRLVSKLQEDYPGQLPDSAIKQFGKSLPQNIALINESHLVNLIVSSGQINVFVASWECQNASQADLKKRMHDLILFSTCRNGISSTSGTEILDKFLST